MSDIGKRFPFDAYPKGWFQVAYSRDVDAGQVVGLHYFGRRLICYRGASATPYVLDAYCPHLGADIAVGGTVADDSIVCPFHGWASTALDRTSKSRTRRP
jgi:phenylpropionate dioxygenase-like ring-hydroxylating dioxygenase large terminal subunit